MPFRIQRRLCVCPARSSSARGWERWWPIGNIKDRFNNLHARLQRQPFACAGVGFPVLHHDRGRHVSAPAVAPSGTLVYQSQRNRARTGVGESQAAMIFRSVWYGRNGPGRTHPPRPRLPLTSSESTLFFIILALPFRLLVTLFTFGSLSTSNLFSSTRRTFTLSFFSFLIQLLS